MVTAVSAQQHYRDKVRQHARQDLVIKPGTKPAEALSAYKQFLKVETHRLRMLHNAGASGREVAQGRAHVLDLFLDHLFKVAIENARQQAGLTPVPLLLIALISLLFVPTRNLVSSKRVATNINDGGTTNFLGLAAISKPRSSVQAAI